MGTGAVCQQLKQRLDDGDHDHQPGLHMEALLKEVGEGEKGKREGTGEIINKRELCVVAWWHTFIIPVFGKHRQKKEYCTFRTSLVYVVQSRTVRAT